MRHKLGLMLKSLWAVVFIVAAVGATGTANAGYGYPIKTVVYDDYTYILYPEKPDSKLVIQHAGQETTKSLDFYLSVGGWVHDAYPYNIDIAVNSYGFVLTFSGFYNNDGAFLMHQYDFDGNLLKENIRVGSEVYGGASGAVKTLNDGNFLVVWTTNAPNGYPTIASDTGYYQYVVGRLVSADCSRLGKTFIISAGSHYLSEVPSITQDESGAIYVSWSEYQSVVNGISTTVQFDARPIDQLIYGSPGDDVIFGLDGNDNVTGNNGNDVIDGGTENDTINGSAGSDQLTGGDGSDVATGGAGNDTINGDAPSAGASRLMSVSVAAVSAAGEDTAVFSGRLSEYTVSYNAITKGFSIADNVPGRDGTDTVTGTEYFRFSDGTRAASSLVSMNIDGTEAIDKITGGTGDDKLRGLGGNDTINGNGGNDEIDGGAGADIMSGGDGDDSYVVDNAGDKVKENARPGGGTDTVYTSLPAYTMPANVENLVYTGESGFSGKGNKSSNRMTGGPGADTLDGQKGTDVMFGLGGDDTYVVDSPADLVNEDPDSGTDVVISSVTVTTLSSNVEVLSLSKGNINGTGNALDNVIVGSSRNNILSGGDGADTLIGGKGNDSFYGETTASPGDDADTVAYSDATKGVIFSLANTLSGQNTVGSGTDRVYDNSSIENLTGSNFNDALTGSAIGNVIRGANGNDTIAGLTGADFLIGDGGLDLIDCGSDTDIDRVAYVLSSDSSVGTNRDQVSNFATGVDIIDLSVMDANTSLDGDQAFAFSDATPGSYSVWYAINGPDLVVSGDNNGDAVADFEILLKNVDQLTASNFAL